MKRWLMTLLFALAVAAAVGVVVWRHVLPRHRVSPLFERYEHADGIAASYIHNYPVNDTLTLDVTLLEATIDSAWQSLCTDFALSDIVEIMEQTDPNTTFLRQVSRHNYTQVALGDSPDAECLAISCNSRTFAVFHTHNKNEMHAVVYHNLKKLSNQDN